MQFDGNTLSRRTALKISGAALAALDQIGLPLNAQNRPPEPPTDRLIAQKPRDITTLALNSDGSAKLFTEADLTPVNEIGALYRNTGGKAPEIEYDAAKVRIRVRGNVMKQIGSFGLDDLKKLPQVTQITKLQCGAAKPAGVVKWGGVRFADVCRMLEMQPMANYAMFVSFDKFSTVEDMTVATNSQTLLAWEMNGGPLLPIHGAPYRLVMPFRWGARSIKAIEEIRFTAATFGVNGQ